MLRQASNWAVLQERVVGARTILCSARKCKDELLLCCSNFSSKSYELSLFERWFFRTTFVGSFVRAWSDITFCYRTSTFLFMNFLRTPVYSFVRTWRTLTFCSLLFLFLTFCESFRILCARTREVFWKAESLLPPETNSAEKFRGPATVTETVPRRLLDHVKHNTMFPTSLRALFWKKTRLKKAPHKSRELLKLFRARPSRSRTGVFKIRSLAQQYNLVVLSRLSPKVQKVIPTNTPRGVSTSDA